MFAAILLALSVATAVQLAVAPDASAATCSGTRIAHKPIRASASSTSTVIGYLDVYYNSSNGYNCARTVHAGPAEGVRRNTAVVLYRCIQVNPGNGCTLDHSVNDTGNYAYYAGPVSLWAGTHCISVYGDIFWNGAYRTQSADGFCDA